MKTKVLTGLVALAMSAAAIADEKKYPATLVQHAQLPAQSFLPAPDDAPVMYNVSGRFTAGARTEKIYSIHDRKTGLSRPFPGQPLQGFSGIRSLGDNRFLTLTDNGFGSKANSADVLLMFNIFAINWETGLVDIEKTVFLADPNRLVPFPIVNEATKSRYLTGADFDIESIQPVGDGYWIGDEFGPWLIHVNADGIVQQVLATQTGDFVYASPDNAFVVAPNPGSHSEKVNVKRSGGFEGMALAENGTTLYPLLEKPIYDHEKNSIEKIHGKAVLRLLEFDTVNQQWADKIIYYPLAAENHAIGDFNMIDAHRALIIERDGGQGDPREGWASKPAKFKRIYLVDLNRTDHHNVLKKIAYIDLMDIQDPNGVATRGTIDGVFVFPFVTIEDVDRVDENTIIVANDNNYPFSVGRQQGRADDNEFILLEVGDFLKAK